ncbi:hypothetical protein [uncultured Draconibacterium sp.]|uniref:hypothetical protein n=1 Tax=uncultured Draconibacterium sp. TaxID=1573823 RepID=UPI0029C84893|nr:hypothetical protein [uncultured Draconibacterium sp.]
MKMILPIILLFTVYFCIAQEAEPEKRIADFQNKWLKTAEESLQNNEIRNAYVAFSFVSIMDSLSEKGNIAISKADSLRPILRTKLIPKLIGTWKLKSTGSNWGMSEIDKDSKKDKILIISAETLSFYEVNIRTNKRHLIRSERLKFNNIQSDFPSFSEFIYSDNQIWSYSLNNDDTILHMTNTGELNRNNSRTLIVCGNSELIYERIK